MKYLNLLLTSSVASASVLLNIQAHDGATKPNVQAAQLARRNMKRDTVDVVVDRKYAYYEAEVSLGTPPQLVTLLLDTGSSDLWVLDSTNTTCLDERMGPEVQESWSAINCSYGALYDPGASSTYKLNATSMKGYRPGDEYPFEINYGDGAGAKGFWATETLSFGDGHKVSKFDFGLAKRANSGLAILGIGATANEASLASAYGSWSYPNLPMRLKMANLTTSTAYSLWLNSQTSLKGNVLFGGYDKAKLGSELFTVPIKPTHRKFVTEFAVSLNSVTTEKGKTYGTSTVVILDSGTTMTYLPREMVSPIMSAIPSAQYSQQAGMYLLKCSQVPKKGSVEFNFDSGSISVPYKDLVSPLRQVDGSVVNFAAGGEACVVMVDFSDKSTPPILGGSFLRSAYIVYDIDNNKVSMSNALFDVKDSEIVELGPKGVAGTNTTLSKTVGEKSGAGKVLSNTALAVIPLLFFVLA